MPPVSVCIPTYNYARYLPQAIDSVLAQTFGDYELIVVDNASSDNTQEVLAAYSDPRLRTFRNDANIGLFGNFSRCLELAAGDFVKFLCADDWLDATYLERALPLMSSNDNVGLLTTAGYYVNEEGSTFARTAPEFDGKPVVSAAEALQLQAEGLNVIGMPSNVLLRRAAATQAGGFDGRFAPASDVHLWLKVLNRWDLAFLPEPLCYLRIHGTKQHGFGDDPSESTFLGWKDAAAQPGSRIDDRVLATALRAEAERSVLHATALLATGKPRRAMRILAFTGRHVRWHRVAPWILRRLPSILRDQVTRIRALRGGRMVVYGGRVRAGGPLRAD